ncbi:MAG: GNAT family N-acetyltransferase [Ktedonobacterales bacterium]
MAVEDLTRRTRAVEDAWCTAWASLGIVPATPRTMVEATGDLVRVYTPGAPETLLNIVLRHRGGTPSTAGEIERIIAPYRQHQLPFQWWLVPGDEPPGLREALRALGMQTWGGATAMTLDLAGWQPPPGRAALTGITGGRVASARDAHDALDIICDVFLVPPGPMARWTTENPAFDVYLARAGGHPVAALATLRQGGVAGVYHVATLPGARRRGFAGALLAQALHDARQAGCTLAALTATPEARHLYDELGFRACGIIEQWSAGRELIRDLTTGRRHPLGMDSVWD